MRPRRTIAFVTNLVTNYRLSQLIFSGVSAQAAEDDCNLLCLAGNTSHTGLGFQHHLAAISQLLCSNNVNGIVVWGSGILGSTSLENLKLLFHRFRELPLVNLGIQWPGVPSVVVDNYRGMHNAVLHLIEQHGCRRIAFVRGPHYHQEAEIRFRAYVEALEKHNLPVDPVLVADGRFSRESGTAAVAEILDRRHAGFDALAAANDWMMFGAYEELTARGIRVPEAVRLVGFDAVDDCRYLMIPLTTVSQPFGDMGRTAVRHLLRLIEGASVPEETVLPSVLVVRESCGCPNPLLREEAGVRDHDGGYRPEEASEKALAELAENLNRFPNVQSSASAVVRSLASAFTDEMAGSKNTFLNAFSREMGRIVMDDKVDFLHTLLSALRRAFIPVYRGDSSRLIEAENIWQRARILLSEFSFHTSFTEKTRLVVRNQVLQDASLLMIATLNLTELLNLLARELPRLGFLSCSLALFDDPSDVSRARLVFAYADGGRIALAPGGVRFATGDLAPPGILPRRRLLLSVEPLYAGEEQMGFFLFEERSPDIMLNGVMRAQLSMSVRSARLFEEKEKLLTDLAERARQLQSTSEGLTRSNAELEQFAFIASHDLQEPLRKISVFADRLIREYRELSAEESQAFLYRIQSSCMHMKALINDLLTFSRLANLPLQFRRLESSSVMRQVLSDLEPFIENTKAEVRLGILPALEAEPVSLRQLFQNLLSNALKFRQPNIPPIVSVVARMVTINEREYAEFAVTDNGIGIDEKHFERIFALFQRLHGTADFEGTGIGLAICKKITDRYHGTIRVESRPGAGSSFIFTLPTRQ